MSQEMFKEIIDRWVNDPTFRTEIRKDPEGTIQKTGKTLTEEEKLAFKKVDWSLTDEQLKSRISKLP